MSGQTLVQRLVVGGAIALLGGYYLWNKNKQSLRARKIDIENIHGAPVPDYYFHLYLDTLNDDVEDIFGGVQYVILTGSRFDAKNICEYFQRELLGKTKEVKPISKDDRFGLYLCGPLLVINHGLGGSSMSILLQEIIKVLAKAMSHIKGFIRVGRTVSTTLPIGTIVVSGEGLDEYLKPNGEVAVILQKQIRPIVFNPSLARHFNALNHNELSTGKVMGVTSIRKTLGESRLFSSTKESQLEFFEKIRKAGVAQIDTESHVLGQFCGKCRIPSIVVGMVETALCDGKFKTEKQDLTLLFEKLLPLFAECVQLRI